MTSGVDTSGISGGKAGSAAHAARHGNADFVAAALTQSRDQTLNTFDALQRALVRQGRSVPDLPQFNPPLWELGHIGWFQAHWIGRNPHRERGIDADPDVRRLAAPVTATGAAPDALYDSGNVPHDTRFGLSLPTAAATRADLAAQLQQTLSYLADMAGDARTDDRALYFHRLVLMHEDMHHEAALYMADALELLLEPDADATIAGCQLTALPDPPDAMPFEPSRWRLGSSADGFAFDNERCAHDVAVSGCRIDTQVVRWAEFLPFIDSGGYAAPQHWSPQGRVWLASRQSSDRAGALLPSALRRRGADAADATPSPGSGCGWQLRHRGRWQPLDPALPACHLTLYEAEAWCAWAGRRLPSEAEWERAALLEPEAFRWGDVWEWTCSPFEPYPGFVAHPYRDYSAPWFGSRPVLKGASFATHPRMRHPRYRNYFTPERADIYAGFRSCV